MRLFILPFIALLFTGPAFAQRAIEDYTPPDMFAATPAIAKPQIKTPPIPPKRPDRFFASKAYLNQLRAQNRNAGSTQVEVVEMSARDVLRQIED